MLCGGAASCSECFYRCPWECRIHPTVTRRCRQVEEIMALPCWSCSLCCWMLQCFRAIELGMSVLAVWLPQGGGGTSLMAEPKRCGACFRPSPLQPEVVASSGVPHGPAKMEAVTEGGWSALPVPLSPGVLRALQDLGFDRMTPVQVRGRL